MFLRPISPALSGSIIVCLLAMLATIDFVHRWPKNMSLGAIDPVQLTVTMMTIVWSSPLVLGSIVVIALLFIRWAIVGPSGLQPPE